MKTYNKFTAQRIKFSIKDLLSKCDQIPSFPRIWSHLLKKSLMENFIFCAAVVVTKLLLNRGKISTITV